MSWQIPTLDEHIIFDTTDYRLRHRHSSIIHIDPYEFTAILRISRCYRGRRTTGVILESLDDSDIQAYRITLDEFIKSICQLNTNCGIFQEARWGFAKKGTQITLKLIGPIA